MRSRSFWDAAAARRDGGRRCSLAALQPLRSAVLARRPGNRAGRCRDRLRILGQGTWGAERQPGLLPGRQGPVRSPGPRADLCRGHRPRRARHASDTESRWCARKKTRWTVIGHCWWHAGFSRRGVTISHIHADGTLESHQAMESRLLAAASFRKEICSPAAKSSSPTPIAFGASGSRTRKRPRNKPSNKSREMPTHETFHQRDLDTAVYGCENAIRSQHFGGRIPHKAFCAVALNRAEPYPIYYAYYSSSSALRRGEDCPRRAVRPPHARSADGDCASHSIRSRSLTPRKSGFALRLPATLLHSSPTLPRTFTP